MNENGDALIPTAVKDKDQIFKLRKKKKSKLNDNIHLNFLI